MFVEYVWLVPLLPFLAFLAILGWRNALPKGGGPVALLFVGGSFVLSALIFWEVWSQGVTYSTPPIEWLAIGSSTIEMGFLVDNLSAFMALLVSLLSTLIVLYSFGYMKEEGQKLPRYYLEITLFIAGMLGTVLADNYLLMFMSWEIMGLCSYLLIGYWFHKPSAASAAKKAFLVTRIGDISLLLGMLILFHVFGSFSYRAIFEQTALIDANPGLMSIASLLIFGGAIGKSAQFPLHVWLPDAMEGPTTVSALIHAATMVKGGVFLVARSFPLYAHTPDVFLFVGLIGGVTAFMAATMALVQWDIKRVLAYSTLSQLGYMFLALGAGGWIVSHTGDGMGFTVGLFHLMNHAFFKALLFLAAGSVILGVHHINDMRKMGGLHSKMPVTSWTMLIGSLAIAGIPPLSGFWSKDEILATVQHAGQEGQVMFTLLWLLALATAFLTGFYMFRMWFLTFGGKPKSEHAEHAHESPRVMTMPLVILAVFAAISGFFLFAGLTDFLGFHIHEFVPGVPVAEAPEGGAILMIHILANPWTWFGTIVGLSGVLLAYLTYSRHRYDPSKWVADAPGKQIHSVLADLYGYDRAFMTAGEKVSMGLARVSNRFDQQIVDGAVRGVGTVTVASSARATGTQTGRVTTYAATVITGAALVLLTVVWLSAWLKGVF
jgi:proton-translocating NADH-quinone oxidoreductase chain L